MSITVYSKPNCAQCDWTKTELDRQGLQYNTVDLTQDMDSFNMIREMGYMQAPVVVVGENQEEHWSGFQPDRIAKLEK